MKNTQTMARMDKVTLVELAKHKLVPTETYNHTLARLLGLKRPPKQFKFKEVITNGKTKA